MSSDVLTATLEIHDGSPSPIGSTVTLALDGSGFRDVDGMGRAGDSDATVSAERVAASLAQTYDVAQLRALLAQLVKLHDALPAT